MIDELKGLAKDLRPPKAGEDPREWQFNMWVSLLVTMAVVFLYLLADIGAFDRLGLSSGARAEDLSDVVEAQSVELAKIVNKHDVDIMRLESKIDTAISKQDIALRLSLAAEICRLIGLRGAEDNAALRTQLTRSIQEKQEQYMTVNDGRVYSIAECA